MMEPTSPRWEEFVLFRDYFVRQGFRCEIVDPGEIEFEGGRPRGPSGQIDLIYKRVLLHELVERGGINHPILRAFREGAVCMVNPPACKILHKKASLAVLHDERNAHLFDAEEREAIALSIPWTTRSAASVQPRCLSIISPERITEPGFTLSRSAYLGAVPCVASKTACPVM